jgi:hypothetical protein
MLSRPITWRLINSAHSPKIKPSALGLIVGPRHDQPPADELS